MKIYNQGLFIDEPEYLQLAVINMWDFKTNPICFRHIEGLGGQHLISYCLYKYTKVSKGTWNAELITTISDEMKNEFIRMEYTLPEPPKDESNG